MDREARARCLSRPPKRYEVYKSKKGVLHTVRMPRANTLQPIEEAQSGKSGKTLALEVRDKMSVTGLSIQTSLSESPTQYRRNRVLKSARARTELPRYRRGSRTSRRGARSIRSLCVEGLPPPALSQPRRKTSDVPAVNGHSSPTIVRVNTSLQPKSRIFFLRDPEKSPKKKQKYALAPLTSGGRTRENSVFPARRATSGDAGEMSREPRWVGVETREPIFATPVVTSTPRRPATTRQRRPDGKPPVPPGYRRSDEVIYSVVNKNRPVVPHEPSDRRKELEDWLKSASRQRGDMFQDGDWRREPHSVAAPGGIAGLVGRYRIEQNKSDDQNQYILEEEELVEDVVDSVSEAAPSCRDQPKWSLTDETQPGVGDNADDDDNETIVPDYSEVEEDVKTIKDEEVKPTESVRGSWRLDARIDSFVKYGKEERAVDVPDGASADSVSTANAKAPAASNEQHDKDSLNETGSTTGGTVDATPAGAAGPSNRADRGGGDGGSPPREPNMRSHSPPPKSLVSRLLARSRTPDDLLDHSEPFSQLWVVLSNVYGELVIVLTMALCLAEVMDTPVPLLSLQGIFLMYMYVGSIAVILGIYIWVLVDSCGSIRGGETSLRDAELGGTSLTRFGSLKRAHISRSRTAPTSFYIRVGALLFGLATLVFNGLEMAMHSMMQGTECLSDVIFVHPVLHGLFTFLQMHFLFVNSQVLVEKFGLAARFGFTHLAATNIAVWTRLVIWDSAQEWTYFVHVAQRGSLTGSSPLNLRGFPGSLTKQSLTREIPDSSPYDSVSTYHYEPISQEQISQVVALQECLNTNTLGQLWTSSMPFLYPFIVQFSLIAAAVTFVMGQNVGRSSRLLHKKFHSMKDLPSAGRVGCDGSSKGLFLGILCMVAGIVVILIFLVVREDENFPPATLSWLTCGTLIAILTLSGIMTGSGLVQIRRMSIVTRNSSRLDELLSNVALFGVQLYSIFTIVVCSCTLFTLESREDSEKEIEDSRGRHTMLLSVSVLQLLQCFAQSTLIAETSKRCCITRHQTMAKPGRQVVTFLLFSNAVLWAFDTVVTQNWVSQELQLRFFGVLAWGVISRIGLPLLIFYRFHSCVLLLEAWNKCYRTFRSDHPLN